MEDPRHEPEWSSAYWRDEHPLHIQDSWYTVVADDLEGASQFFVDALHAKVVHDTEATVYGTRSRFVAVGDTVVLEIAQPFDNETAAARDLAARTPFHAVTFRVADLARAVAHVEAQGITVTRPADGHAALDSADTLGVQFRMTDQRYTGW